MKNNINVFLYKTLSRVVALGFLVSMLASCTFDLDENVNQPPVTGSGQISFSTNIPDTQLPATSTRGMADGNESVVSDIDLLIFNSSATGQPFVELVHGTSMNQTGATVNFNAKPVNKLSGNVCVMVVANARGILTSPAMTSLLATNPAKKDVLAALMHVSAGTNPTGWKWDASSGYTPIPMYGEKTITNLNANTASISGIDLVRMVARIDVVNKDSDFILEKIYLANHYTAGYIAPVWDPATGNITSPSPLDPNTPAASYKKLGASNAIEYTYSSPDGKGYLGEIYTYESPKADDSTEADRVNTTCLIVQGKLTSTGPSYYYRVDFTSTDSTDPASISYMPLKRNYKYTVNVEKAVGAGYTSLANAINSYTAVSNLKTKVISYDRSKVKVAAFNGQYMLGLNTEAIYQNHEYDGDVIFSVYTDYPGGWKAAFEGTRPDWIEFSYWEEETPGKWVERNPVVFEGRGNDHDWSNAQLKVQYFAGNPGETRTAKLKVTTADGRLSLPVEIVQSAYNISGLNLILLDENGVELPKLDEDYEYGYYLMVDRYAKPGQTRIPISRIYAQMTPAKGEPYFKLGPVPHSWWWEGKKTLIEYQDYTAHPEYKTPYTMEYNRQDNYENLVIYNGRLNALEIEPKPLPEDDDKSKDYWDQFLFVACDETNGWGPNIKLWVQQAEWLMITSQLDEYLLGRVDYPLLIKANTPWRIASITETRTDTDGPAFVGTSGNLVDNIITPAGNGTGGAGATYKNWVTDDVRMITSKWYKYRSGVVTVKFESLDGTKEATFKFNMRAHYLDYTNDGTQRPFFYTFPITLPYYSPLELNYEEHQTVEATVPRKFSVSQDICSRIGDNWRLPTYSEALLMYVYREGLTYKRRDNNPRSEWYNHQYWTLSGGSDAPSGNRMSFQYMDGYNDYIPPESAVRFTRCIYTPTEPGAFVDPPTNVPVPPVGAQKVYPYLVNATDGPVIVSYDPAGGVKDITLYDSGNVPNPNLTYDAVDLLHNRVPPKLQVYKTNTQKPGSIYYTRDEALQVCTDLGSGWRLPNQREFFLMWAMGMSQSHVANATYISADKLWSMGPAISVSGYEGAIADYVYWTSSREDYSGGEAWIVGAGRGTANTEDPDYAGSVKVGETWTTFGGVRCVRTYTN